MNIFDFRDQLIGDYSRSIKSFIQIRNPSIQQYVERQLAKGVLWPELLIQLNPLFAQRGSVDELVTQGVLHQECTRIFQRED